MRRIADWLERYSLLPTVLLCLAAVIFVLLLLDLVEPAQAQSRFFNGASGGGDKIVLGNPSVLNNISPMTICAWVNPGGFGGTSPRIYDKSDADGTNGGPLVFLGGTNQAQMEAGYRNTVSDVSAVGTVTNSAWNYLCYTWAGGGAVFWHMFIGNRSTAMAEVSYASTANETPPDDSSIAATIGNRKTTANRTFDGNIAHLAIWGCALNATQQDQFRIRSYAPRTSISGCALKGYWPLWGSDATSALDHSGNGSNGTVTGTTVGVGGPFGR